MISNKDSAFTLFEVLAERTARKRHPSQRDQDIAAAVRVQGRRHADVAAEYGLTRRRVSQICRQVEQWHLKTYPWERGEGDEEQRNQTDRPLHRAQLTEIYGAALRAYARSEQPLVTVRRGKRNGQRWSDQSQRQQRLDTGSLRVALQAIKMQWQLTDRPFKKVDEGKDEKGRLSIVLSWVAEMLEFVRKDAEARGAVPKVPGGPMAAVEQMLRVLLGVPAEKSEVEGPMHSRDQWSRSGDQKSEVGDQRPATWEGEAWEGQAVVANALGVGLPTSPEADQRGLETCAERERAWEGEAPAEPGPQRAAATHCDLGSVWETPWEALPDAPSAAASDVASPTCAATPAAGSGFGSAQKIEKGNVSGATGILPVPGQLSASKSSRAAASSTAHDRSRRPDGNTGPETQPSSADPHWLEASATQPTRLERLLASNRHLSRGHRRRVESLVAHRRGSG